jgi:hypothetical protein
MFRLYKRGKVLIRGSQKFWVFHGLPWATFVNYERITIKFNRDTVGGMMHGRGTFVKAQSYHDKFYRYTVYRGFHVRGVRLPYHDKFLIVIRSRPTVDLVRKGIDNYGYRITTTLLKRGTLRALFSVSFGRGVVSYRNEYTLFFTLNKLSRDTGLRGLLRLSYHDKACSYHDKSYHDKPREGVTTRGNCLVCNGVLTGWCS